MKLTKSTIDRLRYDREPVKRPGKKPYYPQMIVWEGTIPGFGVRVGASGKKTFVLYYRELNGRQHMMKLGNYGVLTLKQAQDMAREKLIDVMKGGNPLQQRMDIRRGRTVRQLCDDYMTRYAKEHKKTWMQDQRAINRYILPRWGNRKAASIQNEDMARLHSDIGKKAPYQANRLAALVSKMFQLAKRWGYVPKDYDNPAADLEHYREIRRDRWVKPEELPRLAQAIDEEESPYARVALWLYLLTGVRKTELLSARWDQIDFNRRVLYLPDTKPGRSHEIPLSAPALTLLEQLPRLEDNPFVFPGAKPGAHLVDLKNPWTRVRQKAGVTDIRLHDLRRTVGSWLAQSGNTLHLIGRVLNHSAQDTTAIYARFAQDHVRDALESHAQRLLGVAGKIPPADVVELKDGKKK